LIVGSRHIDKGGIGVPILGIIVPLRWPDEVIGASRNCSTNLNAIALLGGFCVLDNSNKIKRGLIRVGAAQKRI
jgi:hypothetical protein